MAAYQIIVKYGLFSFDLKFCGIWSIEFIYFGRKKNGPKSAWIVPVPSAEAPSVKIANPSKSPSHQLESKCAAMHCMKQRMQLSFIEVEFFNATKCGMSAKSPMKAEPKRRNSFGMAKAKRIAESTSKMTFL